MTKHPSIQSMPFPGSIVEFMQGNEPHLAWVEEASGDKLRLYTLNKRETKLASARLLPWIGPRFEGQFNREAALEKLREHAKRREELASGITPLDIWELAQGEVTQSSAAWFAGLAFENPDVDQVAAMGRALLSLKTHFKFQPPQLRGLCRGDGGAPHGRAGDRPGTRAGGGGRAGVLSRAVDRLGLGPAQGRGQARRAAGPGGGAEA